MGKAFLLKCVISSKGNGGVKDIQGRHIMAVKVLIYSIYFHRLDV